MASWHRTTGASEGRPPPTFGIAMIDGSLPDGGLAGSGVHEVLGGDDDAAPDRRRCCPGRAGTGAGLLAPPRR